MSEAAAASEAPVAPDAEVVAEAVVDAVVEAVVDTGDGWAKGTNARTGKTGTFPLSYIE